jgi:ribosomal protein RSM22 (predicted rRNA methylase)
MATDLPWALRQAIARHLHEVAPGEVTRATAKLSEQYRASVRRGSPVARSHVDVCAYAAYRLPATFAAVLAALQAIGEQRPGWQPRTLLDLGAGLGAGIWAAVDVWPSIESATAIDAEPQMMALGHDLGQAAAHQAIRSAHWTCGDLTTAVPSAAHDLVLLSYVLGELAAVAIPEIVQRAWGATAGTLVVVEPGTPPGYARIIQVREQLLRAGAFITAPCPHDASCPLGGGDWCHFGVRLARSRTHRVAKQGALGFEDEKFSYIGVSRGVTGRTGARVLRHPQIRPKHIRLELCTRAGLRSLTVTKRDSQAFKRARKSAWGDSFEDRAGIGPGTT